MESLSSSSASSVDDAQQEGPGEGPTHVTSRSINGPREGVSHHEENEEVIHVGGKGLPLHARGPKKSRKHGDVETTGEDEGESTSVLTKSTVKRFSGVKQLALVAAIGVMLAVFGRRLMRPISTPVKPPSSGSQPSGELAPTDSKELERQQRELGGKIEKLRQAWDHAGGEVQMLFGSKLAFFKRRFSDDSKPVPVVIDKQLLDGILIPATKVQETPIPPSLEDRVTLRRQLLLMNACVSVAQRQLTFWQDYKARLKQGEKVEKSSSMSVETFSILIEGGRIRRQIQGHSSPRIHWNLAWDVAMNVAETRSEAVAAARSYEAFVPLLKELEEAEHPPDDLHIPEGGVFPAESFINFMKKTQESREKLFRLTLQAARKLVHNFTVEGAHACLSESRRSAAVEARALEDQTTPNSSRKGRSTFGIRFFMTVTFPSPIGNSLSPEFQLDCCEQVVDGTLCRGKNVDASSPSVLEPATSKRTYFNILEERHYIDERDSAAGPHHTSNGFAATQLEQPMKQQGMSFQDLPPTEKLEGQDTRFVTYVVNEGR
ncbi:hypothetical protein Emed_007374 [Eimeria media]